jgi:hypothetical protein
MIKGALVAVPHAVTFRRGKGEDFLQINIVSNQNCELVDA